MNFFAIEEQNKLSPEERIIYSLKSAKLQNRGQTLSILSEDGYMTYNDFCKKGTQKILQKLKKKNMVCYFKETNVWYWTGEE